MWKMLGGLNGKMHAELDRRGGPSPWITYRALPALKRFGALERPWCAVLRGVRLEGASGRTASAWRASTHEVQVGDSPAE